MVDIAWCTLYENVLRCECSAIVRSNRFKLSSMNVPYSRGLPFWCTLADADYIHMLLLMLINVAKQMLLLLIDVMFPNLACQTDANKNDTSGLV